MWNLQAHRSGEFLRRSALYTRLDGALSDHTRFYAAAAMINAVFARLLAAWPGMPSRSSRFLQDVGAALEISNLKYAREIAMRKPSDALDASLVFAEQRQLQCLVDAQQSRCPEHWNEIQRQLNVLLNDRCIAYLAQRCAGAAPVSRVLRRVKHRVGDALDFGIESHRALIGVTLIEDIRNDGL